MLTLKSEAQTRELAATNAVLLVEDTNQPVLLTWHGAEVWVDSRHTAADVAAVLPKED